MAQISRRRTQQITPERLSLLGHPPNVQSTSTKRKRRVLGHSRRLTERATTGEIHISPSRQKSRITLRLRQQQCQGPEPAWWTASEVFAQNDDDKIDKNQNDGEQSQDEAATKEMVRQAWLKRLRPRACHQSSPVKSNETRKSKRVCKV
ncbi:hypothetical protein N7530_002388 [Penicillium desertorum]|uniref:Uncharacterized protein n=1 Tax=Penicillium desertorum TaxID=1303715 RepID=A0A9W9X3L8_9EURO|nr:hypothetical protein N7530_002372 [Penicillium desertorum]KAJ5483142.1 hypothetical protein N7530_002388 [Penicillium desertorum]